MKLPLKDSAQRNQDESFNGENTESLCDEMLQYFLLSLLMMTLMLSEWSRWYFNTPPSPIIYSLIAFVTVTCAVIKIFQTQFELRPFKLGKDKEKVVDQYMQKLRRQGAKIYSGIPSKGFNLDRVVINQNGIFVIETKIYSQTDRGEAKIVFNGESVLMNENIRTSNPIIQVKAEATWLTEILLEITGRKFDVKPVVVFPGWTIELTNEAKSCGLWVLNSKTLPKFIENSQDKLKPEEIEMISHHFSRYILSNRE